MNNPVTFEQIKPDLISLGFGFYGEPSSLPADPERTLLRTIEISQAERKTFLMLLAWLDKARELVHVERLKTLSAELSPPAIPIFGALCLKQVKRGDRRFTSLANIARASVNREINPIRSSFDSDDYLISKYGIDEEFAAFGIHTALISSSDEKKILSWDGILAQSAWLRMRALMGANFRADVAYVMSSKRAENANQAMKFLGCNLETAYRLWKALEQAPDLMKLAG